MTPPALFAAIALLLGGLIGCGDAGDAEQPADHVLLVGGDVFAAGDRVALRLDEMARRTGVLGASAVRLVHVPGAGGDELAQALAEQGPVRAAIVVLGDMHLMAGVDPSRNLPVDQTSVSSRRIDWEAFDDGLDQLQEAADRIGARLVLASPPLGIQGRIELPELLAVAGRLRRRGPIVDLTQAFQALEPGPLFVDGMTVLDRYGHDALAEELLRGLADGTVPIPPGPGLEQRARRTWSELLAWAGGDDEALTRADDQGLLTPVSETRLSVTAATMATALHGLASPARGQWSRLADVAEPYPGLAVGRTFIGADPGAGDPFELELSEILAASVTLDQAARDQAVTRASALVDRLPHRPEAWLVLRLAALLGRRQQGVRWNARGRLEAFDTRPVSSERWSALIEGGPESLRALPALLAVSAPWEGALITGPDLQRARRKARLGQEGAALQILDQALGRGRCPPNWSDERERIAGSRR